MSRAFDLITAERGTTARVERAFEVGINVVLLVLQWLNVHGVIGRKRGAK